LAESIAEQIAVEKQILHLQKMTDYRMRDYTIEELIDLYKTGRISDVNLGASGYDGFKYFFKIMFKTNI
jgi:hypothetical protein